MRVPASRRPIWLAISLSTAMVVAAGCAEIGASDGQGPESPGLADSGRGGTIIVDGSAQDARAPGQGRIDARCGNTGFCGPGGIPDDAYACARFDAGAPPPPAPDAGAGGATNDFDAGTTGGRSSIDDGGLLEASIAQPDAAGLVPDGGTSVAPEPGMDASMDGGVAPPIDPPGVPEDPGTPRGEPFACQVVSDSNKQPTHQCLRTGPGTHGAPCTSVNDCQAGLACVGKVGAGQCLPYCCDPVGHPCGDPKDGGKRSTFCGEGLLLEPNGVAVLLVPVCVPGDSCQLGEPYPCTGPDCVCSPEKGSCTVVKPDGTTACVKPGAGKIGDHCPCAAGYYCSAQNQCVKMCATSDYATCAPGKCQATAGFPEGWGICVGLSPTIQ
jgi:hypothetical protein